MARAFTTDFSKKLFPFGVAVCLFIAVVLNGQAVLAFQADSLKTKQEPRRYIRPCIYLNTYRTPERTIPSQDILTSYGFRQLSAGFYAPLYTQTWLCKDRISLSSLHVLASGNILSVAPAFPGLASDYRMNKTSFGGRLIYNTGKGGIWFADLAPFLANDNSRSHPPTIRYSYSVLFNKTVSRLFGYRVGIAKTYLFGGGFETRTYRFGPYMPLLGMRIGPLDGTYLSLQFPREASLNFRVGSKCSGSVFMKPTGGIYNLSGKSVDFLPQINAQGPVRFGRYEFLNGLRFDYTPGNVFSCFVSTGLSTSRHLTFSSKERAGFFEPFYALKIRPSVFLSAGIAFRFGKAKRVQNDYAMYDAFDLNSGYAGGDENSAPAGSAIPNRPNIELKHASKVDYMDVEDLFQEQELY